MDRPALKRLLEDIQAAQAISRRGTEAGHAGTAPLVCGRSRRTQAAW